MKIIKTATATAAAPSDDAYGSDDELPSEASSIKDRLTWRVDEEDSFSDWTIVISVAKPKND
jgi:hypothetical protein